MKISSLSETLTSPYWFLLWMVWSASMILVNINDDSLLGIILNSILFGVWLASFFCDFLFKSNKRMIELLLKNNDAEFKSWLKLIQENTNLLLKIRSLEAGLYNRKGEQKDG